MLEALLLADLHGEYGKMDSFMEVNPDIVLIAGDITNMGTAKDLETCIARIEVPIFFFFCNCDPEEVASALDRSKCVNLHGSYINLGEFSLVGIGGSNPTPFETPNELTDKHMDDLLKKATEKMERAKHNILISHAPPQGILDEVNGNKVGSYSVAKYMNQFDLVCCAHIHENRGIAEVNGTKVVNPGPAAVGNYAVITFGNDARDIQIELLTL
jgi:Icc-related predicted phosphoesterase